MKKWVNYSLLLAAVAMIVPVAAFAEPADTVATYNITIENNPVVSDLSPEMMTPISKNQVAFHIINNTGKVLYFPDAGENAYIPVVSNNTVTVPFTPGQEYKVMDTDGNLVAKWHLGDAGPIKANVSSVTAEQFAEWDSKLQEVIENQKVSYQEPPSKPEPHYYTKSAHRVSHIVRGYW